MKGHTSSEKILRLIYDFQGFDDPANLDQVVFICSRFMDLGYNHEDFEFVSLNGVKSSKLGWEIFKLSSLELIELGSIHASEKGKQYIEKNLVDVDFSHFAKAVSSVDKASWGWLAAFYYIKSLSKSDPEIKEKFPKIYESSQQQYAKTKEADKKLRSLIT